MNGWFAVGTAPALVVIPRAAGKASAYRRSVESTAFSFSVAMFGLADGLPLELLLLNLAVFDDVLFLWWLVV